MKTELQTITPEWAEKTLAALQAAIEAGTVRQRNVSEITVNRYAADIRNGQWMTTHQGIALDSNGILLDGQHRLWAVKKAGVSVRMMVTSGLNNTLDSGLTPADLIDRGKNRTIAQQLQFHGVANSVSVVATVTAIAKVFTGNPRTSLSMAQTKSILDSFTTDIEQVSNFITSSRQRVGAIIGPLSIYHKFNANNARLFAKGYFTLENLDKTSPMMALYRWRQNTAHVAGREALFRQICVTANCIKSFDEQTIVPAAKASEEARGWLAGLNKGLAKTIRALFI